MKRTIAQLTGQVFDLLVVGGGITGANIAWDATQRGLRVALVDKQDFGGATSSNSLKTVHGGLRYLQDMNLRIVRKMIKERRALLHMAPHLVRPLPVVMPTVKNKLMRSLPVLGTAVKLNDIVGYDRNAGLDPASQLLGGKILSRDMLLGYLPGLAEDTKISGGILWYDAQIVNTERLLLSIVQTAVEGGAVVANYIAVKQYLLEQNRVIGVEAQDQISGRPFEIRAKVVINAAGPWVDKLLNTLPITIPTPTFHLSTAMNLVTRQILPKTAVGLSSQYQHPLSDGRMEERSRVLFVAPWRTYSLVGTIHAPYDGELNTQWVREHHISGLIDEINRAYPDAKLTRDDVYLVHQGFLPMLPDTPDSTAVTLIREGQVYDHALDNGVDGLLSAVGVKYTTGRYLAERSVDKIFQKLGIPPPDCHTQHTRLISGQIEHLDTFMRTGMDSWAVELPPYQIERLLTNYGSQVGALRPLLEADRDQAQPVGEDTAVTKAEIIHAVQSEMALTLSDVVLRRTEMGSAGLPSTQTLTDTASLIATLLGWSKAKQHQEIDQLLNRYAV